MKNELLILGFLSGPIKEISIYTDESRVVPRVWSNGEKKKDEQWVILVSFVLFTFDRRESLIRKTIIAEKCLERKDMCRKVNFRRNACVHNRKGARNYRVASRYWLYNGYSFRNQGMRPWDGVAMNVKKKNKWQSFWWPTDFLKCVNIWISQTIINMVVGFISYPRT